MTTGGGPAARDGQRVPRASITNLGCKVNQAEMDVLTRLLRGRGIRVVADGAPVDLHVVNTCSVTAVADDKSRKAARRARRASPDATVLVTGCAAAVNPAGFAGDGLHVLPGEGAARDALLEEIERLIGGRGSEPGPRTPGGAAGGADVRGALDGPLPTLAGVAAAGSADGSSRIDLVGERSSRIDRTRAFIKVQDGCSFHCTYCIIPRARGAERSLAPDAVLADVRGALADGHREIVLTGINIGSYDGGWSERGARGAHVRSALTLAGLVRRILAETDVERIRLSSIEPQHVDDDLLEAWSTDGAGRCLPHVHLPLQSGDDGVLRRMGRRYDTAFYAGVVARIRAILPGVAVHADVITGFPTEDETAWRRSLAFVRSLDLAGIHLFRYSERPGTPAARMAGQVPEPVRRARAAELLALAASARRRGAARAVGTERSVLFEVPDLAGGWIGHAEDHLFVRAGTDEGFADGRGSAVAARLAAQRSLPHPGVGSLAGELFRVAIEAVDPADPERALGRLIERIPPPGRHPGRLVPATLARSGLGPVASPGSPGLACSGGPA